MSQEGFLITDSFPPQALQLLLRQLLSATVTPITQREVKVFLIALPQMTSTIAYHHHPRHRYHYNHICFSH